MFNFKYVRMLRIFFIVTIFVFTSPLYADWATDTASAGSKPYAICVNPNTNKIYVANYYSDDVTVIDGATN